MDEDAKRQIQIGKVSVSLRLLEEALKFPPNHHIVDVGFDWEDRWGKKIQFIVQGDQMPTITEGEKIPDMQVLQTIEYDEDGRARNIKTKFVRGGF